MRFTHRDGDDSPQYTGVHPHFSTSVEPDGTFELPDDHRAFETVYEALLDVGHKPKETLDDDGSDPLAGVTEEDIVTAEYRELQAIATSLDGVAGNMSHPELEEALILKLRGD